MGRCILIYPPNTSLYDIKNPHNRLYFSRENIVIPSGILSIATYCSQQGGFDFFILNLSYEYAKYVDNKGGKIDSLGENFDCALDYELFLFDKFKSTITDFNPDLIGISGLFDQSLAHIRLIASLIKKIAKDIVVVAGGNIATNFPKEVLDTDVDGITLGHGEEPMLELLNSTDYMDFMQRSEKWLTKYSFNNNQPYKKNLFMDLDKISPLRWDLLNLNDYQRFLGRTKGLFRKYDFGRRIVSIASSRGCPFRCVFCSSHTVHGRKVHNISEKIFLDEIKFLYEVYGINVFAIEDDVFNLDKDRVINIVTNIHEISPDIELEFPSGFAPQFMDEELIRALKESGVKWLQIAIESGCRDVLHNIIRKPLKLEKAIEIIALLQKYDIYVRAFFLLGFPGETKGQMKETIDFMLNSKINWCGIGMAKPIGGSKLYEICRDNNYIKTIDNSVEFLSERKACINTPDFTPEEVDAIVYDANILVNFVNNYDLFRGGSPQKAVIGFDNVLERIPEHPFALYYKAVALRRINEDEKAKECIRQFNSIVAIKPMWKGLINKYGLKGDNVLKC